MTKSVELSRRALVAGVASVASAAVISQSAAANAPAGAVDAKLTELWARRQALAVAYRAADIAAREAAQRMPEWARPGPRYLHSDGTYSGETISWPRVEDGAMPKGSAMMNKRPGPNDIEENYKLNLQIFGPRGAKESRATRDRSRRELADRRRRQRAEERKVGLPGLERTVSEIIDQLLDVEQRILGLVPTPNTIAAGLLIDLAHESNAEDSVAAPSGEMILASRVLEALRPQLHGAICINVEELLDNRSKPISEMAFWPHARGSVAENAAEATDESVS